jgi:hypothetical protein
MQMHLGGDDGEKRTPSKYNNSTVVLRYVGSAASRLAAKDIITRATPLTIMLRPTSVPTTHWELEGQWAKIKPPSRRVMIPSSRNHPDPL